MKRIIGLAVIAFLTWGYVTLVQSVGEVVEQAQHDGGRP